MTDSPTHVLDARGIRVALDLELGQLALFEVYRNGRTISPFARVPWADRPDHATRLPVDMAPHLRRMSGDFFCAPFCADDFQGAPDHGWPANSPWDLIAKSPFDGGITAIFRLRRRVAGAVLEKLWTLRDDHPFLYQEHRFIGGSGSIPVAHHALLNLIKGGLLRFSPKLWAETPEDPLEQDHSVLRYSETATDITAFPGQTRPVDLTRYPIGARHEDFVMLIDDPAQKFGWVTALRPAMNDMVVMIKAVSVLPQTMLWFSNGGRAAAPWNGEHVGVLGIEEACALGLEGWRASIAPNRLSGKGIATAIDLEESRIMSVSTAMGAFPSAATASQSLTVREEYVVLDDGTAVPFHAAHFARIDLI